MKIRNILDIKVVQRDKNRLDVLDKVHEATRSCM